MHAALALLLLLGGAPATGEKSDAPREKRICRGGERQLGSHVRSAPVCRTAAEWEAAERDARTLPLPLKAPQPEAWERTRPQ